MRCFSLTLRSATLFSMMTLITACTSSESVESSSILINTANLFTADIEVPAGEDLVGLYSFNSSNGRSAERARFYQGDEMSFAMNTNQSLQGFEYHAYVYQNENGRDAVYLYKYSKSASTKISELWNYDGEICAIHPVLKGNQSIYDEQARHKSKLAHHERINVEIPLTPSQACDSTINQFIEISFEEGLSSDKLKLTQLSLINRAALIDYDYLTTETDSDGKTLSFRGRDLGLFDNRNGTMAMKSPEETLNWSTLIANNSDVIYATQTSNSQVLIQTNTDIYVVSIADLFFFEDVGSSVVPDNIERILFENSARTLDVPNPSSSVLVASNGNTFIIQDGDALYIYLDGVFEKIYDIPATVFSIQMLMLDNNDIYIAQHYNNGLSTLASVQQAGTDWLTSTSILGGLSADQLIIETDSESLYISTFNLGSGADVGWQARIARDGEITEGPFENSQFILSDRVDQIEKNAYLLSSNYVDANHYMISPSLYDLDIERPNGRQLKRDSSGAIVRDEDGNALGNSYGTIDTTIKNATNLVKVNDIFAYFNTLNSDDSSRKVFVDLSDDGNSSIQQMWTSDVE